MRLRALTLAGLILASGCATTRGTLGGVTAIDTDPDETQGRAIGRAELLTLEPGKNLDTYSVMETGRGDLAKTRGQYVPFSLGPVHAGWSAQYSSFKGSSKFSTGPVVRLQSQKKPGAGMLDLRYFPNDQNLNYFGFAQNDTMLADLLGQHSFERDRGFIRPGIDYKISDTVSIGLESRFATPRFSHEYTGIRVRLNFEK